MRALHLLRTGAPLGIFAGVSAIAVAAFFGGCGNLITLADSADANDAINDNEDGSTHTDASDAGAIAIDCTGEDASFGPPNNLACTGLYADWASQTIDPLVRAYDPALHFGGAEIAKQRWVYIPPGSKIDTTDMNEWSFPIGFKAWQEIRVAGHRVETRMFWKRGDDSRDWVRTTYRWSDDEKAATSITMGEADAHGAYAVPSVAECDACHAGRADRVLGFEAVALSQPGASPTIDALYADGLITARPAIPLVIPDDGTGRGSKALAWLHANCGTSCHNGSDASLAAITGLNLRLDVGANGLGKTIRETNAYATSVNQRAVFQEHSPRGGWRRIVPGDAAQSLIAFRTRSGDPEAAMPPIDANITDVQGIALVQDWVSHGAF